MGKEIISGIHLTQGHEQICTHKLLRAVNHARNRVSGSTETRLETERDFNASSLRIFLSAFTGRDLKLAKSPNSVVLTSPDWNKHHTAWSPWKQIWNLHLFCYIETNRWRAEIMKPFLMVTLIMFCKSRNETRRSLCSLLRSYPLIVCTIQHIFTVFCCCLAKFAWKKFKILIYNWMNET